MIVFLCLFGPIILTFDTSTPNVANANRTAGWPHIWGTDNLGRDAFARALIGGRISLAVGFVAMTVSIVIGSLVGVIAGYFRRLNTPLMALTDLFLSLPLLPILLVTVVLFRDPVQDRFGDNLGIFILMVGSSAVRAGCRQPASFAVRSCRSRKKSSCWPADRSVPDRRC